MKTNRRFKLVSLLSVVVLLAFAVSFFTAMPTVAKDGPNRHSKNPNWTYQTIPVSMQMEAGTPFEQPWDTSDGSRCVHSGFGWIAPFGRASYVGVVGYPPAADYRPAYMDDDTWSALFGGTGLFCIYSLEDGDIYVFDGVMGNLEPGVDDDGKSDYLINVIVGGTGRYKDANGMFVGRTTGRLDGGPDTGLPLSLLKTMEGYINIKVKESKVKPKKVRKAALPFVGSRNPQKWPEALDYLVGGSTIPINIEMEAGRMFWNPWTSGTTMIAGVGWVQPFGRSDYHYGFGFDEDTEELRPDFMDDPSWSDYYPTNNLCIYHFPTGDLYVYDGIVGNLAPASPDGKSDYIIEVIVGGTGDYEGATGMILGYTCGRGEAAIPTYDGATGPFPLPDSIIKIMEGYIRIK